MDEFGLIPLPWQGVRHFGFSILDTGSFPANVLGIHDALVDFTTGISSS
jgi:hypothetical protein